MKADLAFAFSGDRFLVRPTDDAVEVPTPAEVVKALGPSLADSARVGATVRPVDGREVRLFDLGPDAEPLPGLELVGLRASHALLPDPLFRAAGTARQKVDWVRTHRFCSRCGTPLRMAAGHEGLECPSCGQMHFPRLAPAVIVLIERGREALLGRSARFTPGIYSTLAGFVEPGESLEECVHREIEEEVGVRVKNLRYFGSQPHPFPHSLMIGFTAEWASGEIRIDQDEIEDARWFDADDLPPLPHPMSIARALIEDFADRARHG